MSKELYQRIYEENKLYGIVGDNPGEKYFKHYKHWINGSVIDFGCGRGHAIRLIKKHFPQYEHKGIDQIILDKEMLSGDITKPIDPDIIKGMTVALSCDVYEHIVDEYLIGLVENMKKCKRQIITVSNRIGGQWFEGEEHEDLHPNIKSHEDWEKWVTKNGLIIKQKIKIEKRVMLFLCENR